MSKRRRKAGSSRRVHLNKARGKIDKRVEAVGPKHFGIVSVDCAKARSKWMLCDFYGNVLVPPTEVEHQQTGFQEAIDQLAAAIGEHQLKDVVVAIERTGNYHLPVKRAFAAAGYEVRIVHPFASKQFRQVADGSVKTDDNDLAGIHRATVVGFGLLEEPLPPRYAQLQLLARHRRDLVRKNSRLRCQIREHLDAALPGYAAVFAKRLFDSPLAIPLALEFASARRLLEVGIGGMDRWLRQEKIRFQHASLVKISAWAQRAAEPHPEAPLHLRILAELEQDRRAKLQKIQALEGDIVPYLVETPYVLLLVIPGINVVSAADLAGEMGPITHYANANAITGRAGLYPGRYQSDEVDKKGKLVRSANKRLRAVILQITNNLLTCNDYFQALAIGWDADDVDERIQHVRVAKRFTRLAYPMVAGGIVFDHPCCREPAYILDKLLHFQLEHAMDWEALQANLNTATEQLPKNIFHREAATLAEKRQQLSHARKPGLRRIGEVLGEVLAKRLGMVLQSEMEDQTSNA